MVDRGLQGRRHVPFEEVQRLDEELTRLGRGEGAGKLLLGEILEALAAGEGFHQLGFSTLEAYALERCEVKARFANDSRLMARRLGNLPHLRAALRKGEISWSMAEVCARHATPETDAAVASDARASTVRGMRKRFEEPVEVEPDVRRTLERKVPIGDLWAVERTRILLDAAFGYQSDDAVVEILLAEGMVSLQCLLGSRMEVPFVDERADRERQAYWDLRAGWRDEAEGEAEEGIPKFVPPPADAPPEVELPKDPHALDVLARQAARALATRDLEMGDLARQLFDANGWRRLAYASEEQYVRERVGISHSALKARMTLSRRAESMPAIRAALTEGKIGFEAAQLVGRVANGGTSAGWIEQAERRTILSRRVVGGGGSKSSTDEAACAGAS